MTSIRSRLTQKRASVADFQSLPDTTITIKRISNSVSLENGDELRVLLESFPPRPLEWTFLIWPSEFIEFNGSSHTETSSGPGDTNAVDEYRFKARSPPDITCTMQQMLRFMYASTIGSLNEALLYEIDVRLQPAKQCA
ncbi:MAG: hypothetical protein ACKV0T_15375 [Planctomycetales bacterium]